MKIAHFTDDNIFLDNAYAQFEACFPNQNHLFVLSNENKLKKIKKTQNITITKSYSKLNIHDYDYLVFHSLGLENAKFLNKCKINSQKVLWLLHGYEVYSLNDFNTESIYDQITLNHFNLKATLKKKIKNKIRPIANLLINTDTKEIKNAMKKIDFLGVPYIEEFDFLSEKFHLKAKWLEFSYYPLDSIIQKNFKTITGTNILVGNSATPSSNHLDVFEKLKVIKLGESQKIICPLSYGDEHYAKEIIRIGKKMFGNHFFPLTDFMPLNDYIELISTCSITIMNHRRQQGFGTILSMIYRGSHVFLNDNSTIYHFCKNNNIIISNINRIENISFLNQNQIFNNRSTIENLFNKEKLALLLKNKMISYI
jgi:hypothetical protein